MSRMREVRGEDNKGGHGRLPGKEGCGRWSSVEECVCARVRVRTCVHECLCMH